MIASQSRKSAHRVRRPSTGHGRVQPDTQLWSQVVRQFTIFDATSRSFKGRFIFASLAEASKSQSHTFPAAPKSP